MEKLNSARPVVAEVCGEKFKNYYRYGLNIILQKGVEGRVIISFEHHTIQKVQRPSPRTG